MTAFRVGQRVRIVACDVRYESGLVGQETFISSDSGDYWNLAVCWIMQPGVNVLCRKDEASDYLVPILDDHEACESEFKETLDKLLEGLPA